MKMTTVNDMVVHYAECGSGVAVLALHGAYSTHHEIKGFLEPLFDDRPGCRRRHPDQVAGLALICPIMEDPMLQAANSAGQRSGSHLDGVERRDGVGADEKWAGSRLSTGR